MHHFENFAWYIQLCGSSRICTTRSCILCHFIACSLLLSLCSKWKRRDVIPPEIGYELQRATLDDLWPLHTIALMYHERSLLNKCILASRELIYSGVFSAGTYFTGWTCSVLKEPHSICRSTSALQETSQSNRYPYIYLLTVPISLMPNLWHAFHIVMQSNNNAGCIMSGWTTGWLGWGKITLWWENVQTSFNNCFQISLFLNFTASC